MKLKLGSAVLLLLATGGTFAAAPEMNEYARGVTINVPTLQPLIETTLPDDVYQSVTRADLRDLRVFNAAGSVVPHAFCTSPTTSEPVITEQSLPVFQLREAARSDGDDSRVEVQTAGGTQVRVEESSGSNRGTATNGGSHIIDARGVEQTLRAIQFDWESPDGASEVKVRIETSEDLDSWRIAVPASTLLLATQGAQELKRERIGLPEQHYKYLRVERVDGGPPLLINAVTAELVSGMSEIEPLWFTPNAIPSPQPEAGIVLFDTLRQAPVTYARLRLTQDNSSVRVNLQSRADPQASWIGRWSGEVYVIATDTQRRESPPARFGATTDRYWRVELPKDASVQPILELGYRPLRLRFLGQGPAPFTVAFGSRRASLASPASCDGLIADVSTADRQRLVGEGYTGALQTLGGDTALKPPPKRTPARLVILWSVLIVGVALLVTMALSLLKRLRTPT